MLVPDIDSVPDLSPAPLEEPLVCDPEYLSPLTCCAPLYKAAATGDVASVRRILQANPEVIDHQEAQVVCVVSPLNYV